MKKNFTTALRVRECNPPLVAMPPPFPRKRGHYKAPRSHVLISDSTLSTGCSAPLNRGGKGTRFVREQSDLRIV